MAAMIVPLLDSNDATIAGEHKVVEACAKPGRARAFTFFVVDPERIYTFIYAEAGQLKRTVAHVNGRRRGLEGAALDAEKGAPAPKQFDARALFDVARRLGLDIDAITSSTFTVLQPDK